MGKFDISKRIETKEEYNQIIFEINLLVDAAEGTKEFLRLNALSELVENYDIQNGEYDFLKSKM